jgi:hypothetical protein
MSNLYDVYCGQASVVDRFDNMRGDLLAAGSTFLASLWAAMSEPDKKALMEMRNQGGKFALECGFSNQGVFDIALLSISPSGRRTAIPWPVEGVAARDGDYGGWQLTQVPEPPAAGPVRKLRAPQ